MNKYVDNQRFAEAYDLLLKTGKIKNKSDFAKKLGFSTPQLVYDIFRMKLRVSREAVATLERIFGISSHYVLFGSGSIMDPGSGDATIILPKTYYVPMVSKFMFESYANSCDDESFLYSLPTFPFPSVSDPAGISIAFEMKGDCMDNGLKGSYEDGDILYCRKLDQEYLNSTDLSLKKGSFVLIHKTEGVLVRKIKSHDLKTGEIIVHPLNPEYKDQVIMLADTLQVFSVIHSLQKS